MPAEETVGRIVHKIRKDMNVPETEAFILYVNLKYSVPYHLTFKEVYDKYKKDDGMLYLHFQIGEFEY